MAESPQWSLGTARLRARKWHDDGADKALAHVLWSDPRVTRFLTRGGKLTPEEVEARLMSEVRSGQAHQLQYFPFFLREGGPTPTPTSRSSGKNLVGPERTADLGGGGVGGGDGAAGLRGGGAEGESLVVVGDGELVSTFVGVCGFRLFEEGGLCGPAGVKKVEMGFHVRPEHWRRGFAREMATGVLDWLFQAAADRSNSDVPSHSLRYDEVFAGHHPENSVSAHLIRSLGFELLGEESYPPTGLMHPSYRLDKETWLRLAAERRGSGKGIGVGGDGALPNDAEERVAWIYGSRGTSELQARYDQWAADYDRDLTNVYGWSAPQRAGETLGRFIAPCARAVSKILDAGAGSGLVGVELSRMGFDTLVAMDLSEGMLREARRKGPDVYQSFHQMVLGEHLAFETDEFDAVISVGVLTLGHAPASSLDELVRVTRSGGHVVFSLRPDVYESGGFREKMGALEAGGRWEQLECGEPFNCISAHEPVLHQLWVYRVL